jgi:ABC-type multidrug transport system ATPase subunit
VSIIDNGRILISGAPAELEQQMPFQIVEVKAKPRKTLRQVVDETEGVLGWRAVGDRLRLSVANQVEVQERLGAELEKAGAQVSILRGAQNQMEDVFIYLVEEQEKQA